MLYWIPSHFKCAMQILLYLNKLERGQYQDATYEVLSQFFLKKLFKEYYISLPSDLVKEQNDSI